jgi:hypothetical protein
MREVSFTGTSEKEGQLQPRLDAQPAVNSNSSKAGRSNFRMYKETNWKYKSRSMGKVF